MANSVNGEVAFSVEGKDYTFRLDLNALCEAEEHVPGIMEGGVKVKSFKTVRAIFWAGLQEHHPGLSLKEAGRIAQAYGVGEAGKLIGEGMKRSFPKAEGGEGADRP